MSKGPEDAPLGAAPRLPPPTGAAAKRARHAFSSYLAKLRDAPATAGDAAKTTGPLKFGGGRRYDLALSKVEDVPAMAFGPAVQESSAYSWSANGDLRPNRPPPGAPTVRPPIIRPPGPERVPQELLEQTADSALLQSDPDGGTSFDIAFSDELFKELACRISVRNGRVVASFRVEDANVRRLLEAEAGRLRARLEERGLRVDGVRVESVPDP